MSWIAFHHLVGWFEACVCDLLNSNLFVESFFSRDDWGVSDHREMDTWVGHQVSLELSQIDVQGSVESERCSDGRDDLTDQSVQVVVRRSLNVEVFATDVVDGFVVDHEGAVSVLQGSMSGQDRVIRFYNCCRHLWSRIDGKLKLRLLAIIHGQSFHEERRETRPGTSAERMEDQESLETGA